MKPQSILMLLLLALVAFALCQPARAGEPGWHLAAGVMALTNSTQQGGQGPEGSTILTQSELFYHTSWAGIGGFFQYDKQGSNETDSAVGPKLELHTGPFYLEGGIALSMKRAFTDRTIANQTGTGWFFGLGTRFMLRSNSSGGSGGGLFLQFSYKFRTQTIKQQDGVALSEPITQKDGYPLFGIGLKL